MWLHENGRNQDSNLDQGILSKLNSPRNLFRNNPATTTPKTCPTTSTLLYASKYNHWINNHRKKSNSSFGLVLDRFHDDSSKRTFILWYSRTSINLILLEMTSSSYLLDFFNPIITECLWKCHWFLRIGEYSFENEAKYFWY